MCRSMGEGGNSGMSRKGKSWGRTAAEEEWLSQEVLYINTS